MVCSELEPGVAEWKVLTNPLSYGGILVLPLFAGQSVKTNNFTRFGASWEFRDVKIGL